MAEIDLYQLQLDMEWLQTAESQTAEATARVLAQIPALLSAVRERDQLRAELARLRTGFSTMAATAPPFVAREIRRRLEEP